MALQLINKGDTLMTATKKQILYGIITFGLLLLIFQLPIPVTTMMTIVGIVSVAFGLVSLAIAPLMRRGKIRPGWWARSATEVFWGGIGFLAMGFGQLVHLVVENNLAVQLRMAATLVFIVAILVGRSRAKALGRV